MKRIAATAALILTAASPALASSQLAESLGVDRADLSTSELAVLHFNQDASISEKVALTGAASDYTVSTKSAVNGTAEAIFASLALEDGPTAGSAGTATIYSSAVVNGTAAKIFADIAASG